MTAVGTARMRPEESKRKEYLSLLGVDSKEALEDAIVRKLLGAINSQAKGVLPIRLASIVDQFSIEPKPNVALGTKDGAIEFDASRQRFVITLFKKTDETQEPRRLPSRSPSRLRFTYAHEVAHRFFFVEDGDRWVRAIQLVSQDLDLAERMKTVRTLGRFEEAMCNNIARRILIPDESLVNIVAPPIIQELIRNRGRLMEVLGDLSTTFKVSRECLLVRLQRGIDAGLVAFKIPAVMFVLGKSFGSTGDRGSWRSRVRVPVSPLRVEGRRLKPVFPGMTIEGLGEVAASVLTGILSSSERQGEITMRIELREIGNDGKERALMADLAGWWSRLHPTVEDSRQSLALWGRIRFV
jgi:hypothetical protein